MRARAIWVSVTQHMECRTAERPANWWVPQLHVGGSNEQQEGTVQLHSIKGFPERRTDAAANTLITHDTTNNPCLGQSSSVAAAVRSCHTTETFSPSFPRSYPILSNLIGRITFVNMQVRCNWSKRNISRY